jgi:hypothetical protein
VDTYKYTVVPGEYGELIQASDEIPAGSDISKEEDSDCEDREWLHLLEAWDRGADTSQSHGRRVGKSCSSRASSCFTGSEVSRRSSSSSSLVV